MLPKFVTSALLSPYREKSKLRLNVGGLRRPGGDGRKLDCYREVLWISIV
jgi:hypothetical protein